MSFPWAWGKFWEWFLSVSSVVRILRTGWLGHFTCVWNNVAWPRNPNCNCARPTAFLCELIPHRESSLKYPWLVTLCSHHPLYFNYTLPLPHATGAKEMTFSFFSEGKTPIPGVGCLTSLVDLSSGKLSKYFFESFSWISLKEYILSSGSHIGIHHTEASHYWLVSIKRQWLLRKYLQVNPGWKARI